MKKDHRLDVLLKRIVKALLEYRKFKERYNVKI